MASHLVRACLVALMLPALAASARAERLRPAVTLQAPIDGVRALLEASRAVTVFDIVTASGSEGVITLTGKVTSKAKRDQLETEVATVPGVRQVVNRIAVMPASASDDAVRHRVARAIYGHTSFRQYAAMSHPPIRVIVERGHVTLAGSVRTAVERLMATSIAEEAAGSKVDDQLRIGS